MAMWGGRFGAETDKELAKFSESISYDRRLYPYDIAGSKAHVKMLGATGIIPVATAKGYRRWTGGDSAPYSGWQVYF